MLIEISAPFTATSRVVAELYVHFTFVSIKQAISDELAARFT